MAETKLTAEQLAAIAKLKISDEAKIALRDNIKNALKHAAKYTSPYLKHLAMMMYLANDQRFKTPPLPREQRTFQQFAAGDLDGRINRIFSSDVKKNFLPNIYKENDALLQAVFPLVGSLDKELLGQRGRKIADNTVEVEEILTCCDSYSQDGLNRMAEIFKGVDVDLFPDDKEKKEFLDRYSPNDNSIKAKIFNGFFFHLKQNLLEKKDGLAGMLEYNKKSGRLNKHINVLRNYILLKSKKTFYEFSVGSAKERCRIAIENSIVKTVGNNYNKSPEKYQAKIDKMIAGFFATFPSGQHAAEFVGLQKIITENIRNDPRIKAGKLLSKTMQVLKSYETTPQGIWEKIQKFFGKKKFFRKGDGVPEGIKILQGMKIDVNNPQKSLNELKTVVNSINNATKAQGHAQIINESLTDLITAQMSSPELTHIPNSEQLSRIGNITNEATKLSESQKNSDAKITTSRDDISMSWKDFLADSVDKPTIERKITAENTAPKKLPPP